MDCFSVGTVCLFNNWDNCALMMVLDCSLLQLPGSNSNTCKQWRLLRNINRYPIESSTDMVILMTKKSQIQAWLNLIFTRKSGMGSTRLQSMFMQGGIPASRHPWWYNATQACTTLLRSEQYGAVGIPLTVSQSKSDLVAHNSGSCGSVCFLCSCCCFSGKDQGPLDWWFFCHSNCGYFANQFANPFALNTAFLENGRRVYIPKISCCQSTSLAQNHFAKISFCHSFAKISFCQNMDMPKYQSWVLPSISSPPFVCKMIGRKVRKITIWSSPNPSFFTISRGDGPAGTVVPCDSYH